MSQSPDPISMLTGPGGPFEVVTEKVRGVPTRVYKNRMKSLRQVLEGSKGHGDKVFIVQGERRMSFAEHFSLVSSAAQTLRHQVGVRTGDRIAILSANNPEWSVAFWTAQALGAVAVPLNAWWKAKELEYALTNSATSVLVCDLRRLAVVEPILARLDSLRAIYVIGASEESLEHARSLARPQQRVASFSELVSEEEASLPDVSVEEDDYAAIFYTSGTTGKPKGSIATQRNVIANLQNLMLIGLLNRMLDARVGEKSGSAGQDGQMVNLLVVPFFHVTGCFAVLVVYFATGNRIVLMEPGKFDPLAALELIERERVTSFGGVPTVVQRVVDHPKFSEFDTSSVTQIAFGGSPPPAELATKIREKFPNVALRGGAGQAYGLTETSSVATINVGEDYLRRPNSAGKAVPTVEIKIVDAEGNELAPGQRGEIWLKGPIVSPGYWNDPDATAASYTDGWLHTGDIGYLDEDGFLYVVDRAKDMIIRGGENIYSIEVEDVIYSHPAVSECAVVGVPDPDWGEVVKAFVVPKDGASVTPEEIKRYCAERLADYKVPQQVEVRTEPLPRNPAGKVLKPALRGSNTSFSIDADSDSAL